MTGPYFHTGSYLTLRQVVNFYLRGGDFPVTNADDRDPHMLDVSDQAFGFGPTLLTADALGDPVDHIFPDGNHLLGTFADALPDGPFLYDTMPDTSHATTPEPAGTTQDQAEIAVVKFLLSLTDPRVKFERAPFDRPEIFVPIDGAAPANTGGRPGLVAESGVPCFSPGPNSGTTDCFRQLPAVGATGNVLPQPNFLGISSIPVVGANNDHFDQ